MFGLRPNILFLVILHWQALTRHSCYLAFCQHTPPGTLQRVGEVRCGRTFGVRWPRHIWSSTSSRAAVVPGWHIVKTIVNNVPTTNPTTNHIACSTKGLSVGQSSQPSTTVGVLFGAAVAQSFLPPLTSSVQRYFVSTVVSYRWNVLKRRRGRLWIAHKESIHSGYQYENR